MEIFFGGSGHGPSCQISAYYKFFPGEGYFYRTIIPLIEKTFRFFYVKIVTQASEY